MTTPPRYLPARSLPACAHLPGRARNAPGLALAAAGGTAGARAQAPAPALEARNWRAHPAYLWGVDLYNHGYPWEAHEAWEALWRDAASGAPVRAMLQGLIQSAAAVIKARTGHPAGLRTLTARATGHLDRVAREVGPRFLGVDLIGFPAALRAYAAACPLVPDAWPVIALA